MSFLGYKVEVDTRFWSNSEAGAKMQERSKIDLDNYSAVWL